MQRIFTTLLLVLSFSGALFAQSFDRSTVVIADGTGQPEETVCLPVSLHLLDGLSTIQGGIAWDTAALAFVGVELGVLPEFTSADLNLETTAEGSLLFSWSSLSGEGVALPDSALLLELCFVIRPGTPPGAYYVAITDRIKPEASVDLVEVSVDYRSGWVVVPAPGGASLTFDFLLRETCGYTQTDLAASVSGGTPPYSYAWTGPYGFTSDADTLVQLGANGVYRLTVTDQTGATWLGTARYTDANLTGDATPIADVAITPPTCFEATGAITLQMASPVTDYSFAWSTGATTDDIDDLPGGTYAVTVTRTGDSCTQVRFFELQPDETDIVLLANANLVQPDCATQSGGSITLIPAFPDLEFAWSTGSTAQNQTDLATGTYTVTVTNAAGCTEVRTFDLNPPNNFSLSLQQIDAACGTPSGELTATVSDGPDGETYLYAWSTGATTATIEDLPAGTYALTVSSGSGCVRTAEATIEQREELLLDAVVVPIGCDTTGAIQLTVAPGVSIFWADGSAAADYEVTTGGDYPLTLTHPSGCLQTYDFTVLDFRPPFSGIAQETEASGCLAPTGRIAVDFGTELFAYNYIWSDGPSGTGSGTIRSELAPGDYVLYLSNPYGCKDTLSFAVGLTGEFAVATEVAPVICEAPGSIALAGEGAATFSYAWSTGASTQTIDVATAGTYTVTVTTPLGCVRTLTETVGAQTETPQWSTTAVVDPDCGLANGSVSISLAGGTMAAWSTGATGPAVQNLAPGDLELYLTTPNGCRDTADFTLVASTELLIEPISVEITDADCDGQNGAIAVAFPNGDDLSYAWSNGATATILTGLTTGDYSLTVSNTAGCTATFSYAIEEAAGFTVEITEAPISCNGPGSLTATAVGTGDYSYLWASGATTATLDVSAAGSYTVTVTNAATGCERSATIAIEAPPVPRIDSIAIACELLNTCDGTVPVSVFLAGGSGELTVTWSDGAFAQITTGLASRPLDAGTSYAVTVTDAAGCTAFAENIVANCPPPAELQIEHYLECEIDSSGTAPVLQTYLVAEVVSTSSIHTFAWSDGLTDTSYYRSRRLFDATGGPLGLTVTSALGATATLDVAVADLAPCTLAENALIFAAPHLTVAPETSFRYPVQVYNYAGKSGVQTVSWNSCRFLVDSAYLYTYPVTGPTRVDVTASLLAGFNELGIGYTDLGGNPTGDSLLVLELYLTARAEAAGVTPVLFTDTEATLVRAEHGSITVSGPENLVQPGDANRDGAVNQLDLLYLGLAYEATGPDRRRRLLTEMEYAPAWDLQTPASALNLRNVDLDGNGRIATGDTTVLATNWTNGDLGPSPVDTTGGVPLYVVVDTLAPDTDFRIPIYLGNQDQPATTIYGLATTLAWEGEGLVGGSVSLDFAGSWLTEALTYTHSAPADRRIDFALVGRDGMDRSGNGPIAWLSGRTSAAAGATIEFRFGGTRLMNAAEGFFAIAPRATVLVVDNPVAALDPALAGRLALYPVPARDRLYLRTPAGLTVHRLTVMSIDGRVVLAQPGNEPLDVAHLPAGTYLLRVTTEAGVAVLRWVK